MCEVISVIIQIFFGIILGRYALVDCREKHVSLSGLAIMMLLSVLMLLLRFTEAWHGDTGWIWGDFACGLAIGAFFLLISFVSGEKIGYGDSLMIFILGIGIGGWNLVCLLEVSSLLMLVWILWMCIKKRIKRNIRVAFFPFLFWGYVNFFLDTMFIQKFRY